MRPRLLPAALLVLLAGSAAAADERTVHAFLSSWRDAWQAKDLERYVALYAADARVGSRPLGAHRAHEERLFARSESPVIAMGDVEIGTADLAGETLIRVALDQDFRSPSLTDFGRKELLLRETPQGLRIVRETWSPVSGKIETPLGAAPPAVSAPAVPAPPAPAVPAPSAPAQPPAVAVQPPAGTTPPATPAAAAAGDDELRPLLGEGYAPPAPGAGAQPPVDDLLELRPIPPPMPLRGAAGGVPGLPDDVPGRDVVEEIVAKVNGRVLTRSMFLARLDLHHERLLLEDPPDFADRLASLAHDTLETTVDRWLLLQEVQQRQADVEGFWQDWLTQFRAQVGAKDMTELKELLAEQGTTLEQLKEQVIEAEVPNLFIQAEVHERIGMTDEELRKEWSAHPDRYGVPARVTLRQVLIAVPQPGDMAKAEGLAAQALTRLEAGEEWCEVHAVYGEGPRCGEVGTVPLADLLPELRAAADGLPLLAVSKPIRSSLGVHLVQVTAREPAKPLPFEEVRERVQEDLFTRLRDERLEELLDDLRRRGEIEVNPRWASALGIEADAG